MTSRLLLACKYPKTPSLARDTVVPPNRTAILSDVDKFLEENFASLCNAPGYSESSPAWSPRFADPPSEAIKPSPRFFVSPGTTNSVLEEARLSSAVALSSSSSSASSEVSADIPGGGVAVTTFSKDPYDDFLRSMQDMVEASHNGQSLDWDFMEELLFCYLELNERSVHKHILRAFTDLVASFRRRRRRASAVKVRMRMHGKKAQD